MAKQDGKTEKATPRRRKEARREGQTARSQEVAVALSLIGSILVIQAFLPAALAVLREQTTVLFVGARSDLLPVAQIRTSVTAISVAVLAPFLVMAVFAGVTAGLAQVGFHVATKAAKPKLSHLSPKKGMQKFKPSRAGWELFRVVLKLGLLVGILWHPMSQWMGTLGEHRGFGGGLERTVGQVFAIIWRAALLAAVIALADYAYQKWRTEREMKMSRSDVKREHKDQEGDPYQKAARRRRAQEYSRNRMLHDVLSADVVVTNPTHLAVALRYEPGDAAPRVVAKGAGKVAEKIRKLAYRHGVLVTQDKPLARELYRKVKIGRLVPAALFEAVAVVLAMAYRRRGRVSAALPVGGQQVPA